MKARSRSMPCSTDTGSPIYPKTWLRHISKRNVSSACLRTGARHSWAIIFIIRAAGSIRGLSPCWSKRCATKNHEGLGASACGRLGYTRRFALLRRAHRANLVAANWRSDNVDDWLGVVRLYFCALRNVETHRTQTWKTDLVREPDAISPACGMCSAPLASGS
jgi:hypothetical protein